MKAQIRVRPRSSKEEIIALGPTSYKVYMHEPALDGRANRKLIEMLAEYFGIKKNRVRITDGLKSRNKIVEIGEINGENRRYRRKRII